MTGRYGGEDITPIRAVQQRKKITREAFVSSLLQTSLHHWGVESLFKENSYTFAASTTVTHGQGLQVLRAGDRSYLMGSIQS